MPLAFDSSTNDMSNRILEFSLRYQYQSSGLELVLELGLAATLFIFTSNQRIWFLVLRGESNATPICFEDTLSMLAWTRLRNPSFSSTRSSSLEIEISLITEHQYMPPCLISPNIMAEWLGGLVGMKLPITIADS